MRAFALAMVVVLGACEPSAQPGKVDESGVFDAAQYDGDAVAVQPSDTAATSDTVPGSDTANADAAKTGDATAEIAASKCAGQPQCLKPAKDGCAVGGGACAAKLGITLDESDLASGADVVLAGGSVPTGGIIDVMVSIRNLAELPHAAALHVQSVTLDYQGVKGEKTPALACWKDDLSQPCAQTQWQDVVPADFMTMDDALGYVDTLVVRFTRQDDKAREATLHLHLGGDPAWEKMVPAQIVEIVKRDRLFGWK